MTTLSRSAPFALAWFALACAPSAVGPSVASEAPVAASEAPIQSTRERLTEWVAAQPPKLDPLLRPTDVASARAAGLGVDELIEFVLPWLVECQTEAGCRSTPSDADHVALALLIAYDDPRGRELVGGLALAGNWVAEDLLVGASERRVTAVIEASRCVAPPIDEIAAARAELETFRVLDQPRRGAGGQLRARVPSPTELDDLAYFMAAVAEVEVEVGEAWEDHEAPTDPAVRPALSDAFARWQQAVRRADLPSAYAAGIEYVERLGWPGPMRVGSEPEFAWGGARHSYLLRDMAQIAEFVGEYEQAELLYARANPGGGMCGTSASARWRDQVRGFIRSAEARGDCRATVAVRLLDLDARSWWSFGDAEASHRYGAGFDYGVRRLAAAGFDVPRLVRGALLTRNRDADPAALAERLIGPEREVARARLLTHGSERWAARVHAIEGFADTHGEAGLAPLLALIEVGDADTRARAITAIGHAARRVQAGPCDPNLHSAGGSASSHWSRAVRPFGVDCATQLDDLAIARLASQLREHLRDPDPEIRAATAEAFVDMLALTALPALEAQAKREAQRVADEDVEDRWVLDTLVEAIAGLRSAEAPATGAT